MSEFEKKKKHEFVKYAKREIDFGENALWSYFGTMVEKIVRIFCIILLLTNS